MGKVEKEVKRVGRQLDRNVRKGLRSFDQEVGVQAQSRELSNLGKAIMGVPKIEQSKPAAPIKGDAIQPLAAMGAPRESQEAATKDLYRRRRARGVATGPAGLTGEASVKRKRLLGG